MYVCRVHRIPSEHGHTCRIKGWARWDLHSTPKPRRDLEHMVSWRPLCKCMAFLPHCARRLWITVSSSCRLVVAQQLGFTGGHRRTGFTEVLRSVLRKGGMCSSRASELSRRTPLHGHGGSASSPGQVPDNARRAPLSNRKDPQSGARTLIAGPFCGMQTALTSLPTTWQVAK